MIYVLFYIGIYLISSSFIFLIIGSIEKINGKEVDLLGYVAFAPFLIIYYLISLRFIKQKNLYTYKKIDEQHDKFEDTVFAKIKEEFKRGDTLCTLYTYNLVWKRIGLYVKVDNDTEEAFMKVNKSDLVQCNEKYFYSAKVVNKFKL